MSIETELLTRYGVNLGYRQSGDRDFRGDTSRHGHSDRSSELSQGCHNCCHSGRPVWPWTLRSQCSH